MHSFCSKIWDPTDRYDVLGVVLYLEEEPRTIITAHQRENLVREIMISDHSTEQPMVISAWNDLAEDHCNTLSSWVRKFVVVGFTALRATSHKGFSLSLSMSTRIIIDPKREKAAALKEWQARVLEVRNPSKEKVIITLEFLKFKKSYL